MPLPVAIVGGGISGLAAAHYLKVRAVETVVIDGAERLGGLLQTDRIEGCIVEGGADSWLAAKPWARELAVELGLGQDVIGSNDAARGVRVLRRGKLVPYPHDMQLVVPKRLSTVWRSPLFGLGTKLRMSADWVRFSKSPGGDRSVAAFIRSHFGQGAVDYLADPLLSGIYGGNTELLSAEAVLPKFVERERLQGSLTRGIPRDAASHAPVFESMRGGLGQLVEALKPTQVLRGFAEDLERNKGGWRVRVNGNWLNASRIILACPAQRAATLLTSASPELSMLLSGVRYSSAHIVAMAFRNLEPLQGFGLLIPRKEGHHLMAATWVTTKFLGRAPAGLQLVRAFFRQPSSEPVRELCDIAGFRGEPEFVKDYRWPNSLPQYAVGHLALVKQIEAMAARIEGLHLIGNTYHGVGIPDCIRMAKQVAGSLR